MKKPKIQTKTGRILYLKCRCCCHLLYCMVAFFNRYEQKRDMNMKSTTHKNNVSFLSREIMTAKKENGKGFRPRRKSEKKKGRDSLHQRQLFRPVFVS